MFVTVTTTLHPIRALFDKRRRYTVTFNFQENKVSASGSTKATAWVSAALLAEIMLDLIVTTPNPYTED